MAVTVIPVNEPPTITTKSSSATNLSQPENQTSRLYTYRATDPEGSGTVTWSVGGVDAPFFTINGRGDSSSLMRPARRTLKQGWPWGRKMFTT